MSYLTTPTPSILHRQRRKQSMGAKESTERDYQQDQAFWEHKAAVKAAAEERLRMSLYKSPGKVASYREEVQSVEGERTELKAAAKRAAAEAEARFQEEQQRRLNASPEVERPWTIAALSISPQAAADARWRQHAADDKLNRSLFTEVARHRVEEQAREKAEERSATLKEESFFNRGASSEMWIAPERRVRRVNVPAVQASNMPWLASEQSTPAPVRRISVPAGRASSMPWLASEPSTPSSAQDAKPVRQQRHSNHMRVHSRPLWAWDAEPTQKSRR